MKPNTSRRSQALAMAEMVTSKYTPAPFSILILSLKMNRWLVGEEGMTMCSNIASGLSSLGLTGGMNREQIIEIIHVVMVASLGLITVRPSNYLPITFVALGLLTVGYLKGTSSTHH
jgi:hypothetical protein